MLVKSVSNTCEFLINANIDHPNRLVMNFFSYFKKNISAGSGTPVSFVLSFSFKMYIIQLYNIHHRVDLHLLGFILSLVYTPASGLIIHPA